ncbi:MAG: FAD-dependent oxidoreductase [Candidatus Melainabacteria bacterium]|nr:FAD-dependent oxidoreductase [Candidatus Melainabacteria bacterium]
MYTQSPSTTPATRYLFGTEYGAKCTKKVLQTGILSMSLQLKNTTIYVWYAWDTLLSTSVVLKCLKKIERQYTYYLHNPTAVKTMTTIAQDLLAKFKFTELENTYHLGCLASVLNIHAQQQRAFNLAWSLDKIAGVKEKQVAVVGAGVAGLTVAVSLAALGAKVTIFEKTGEMVHLQRGNFVRYVHPNIARWPDKGAGYPLTNLPFMNWRAATAGDVANQITRQWELASAAFLSQFTSRDGKVQVGGDVTKLAWDKDSNKVVLTDAILGDTFHDILILAVGYGVEKTDKSVTPSYWRNDDFAQPIIDATQKKKFLVSGTGDGALTEILRLKLKDFQHKEFFERIMFEPWLLDAKERFDATSDWSQLWGDTTKLRQNYKSFFDQVRQDTIVVLNSKRRWFDSDAQILHKLLVSLLIAAKEIEYKQGKLDSVEQDKKDTTTFIAKKADGVEIDRANVVLQRQGTNSKLEALFFKNRQQDYEDLRRDWSQNDAKEPITFHPKYEVGFLADQFRHAHYEESYEVGFAVVHPRESFLVADQIVRKLKALDNTFTGPDLSTMLDQPIPFAWRNKNAKFSVRIVELIQHGGGRTDAQTPFRRHIPTQVCCLILQTDSKFLLDNLLDDPCLPYHMYRICLAANFPSVAIDDVVNTDAHVFMIKRDGWLEVHCLPGMHQAHQLLRVPTLVEIMGNAWSGQRLGGIGWAVQNLSEVNKLAFRGNELLR